MAIRDRRGLFEFGLDDLRRLVDSNLVAPLARDVGIGHMYNLVVQVHLASQADAIFFIPKVSPL